MLSLQNDTVSWDRPVKSGTDARGTPVFGSAPGFPVSVSCSVQERKAEGTARADGLALSRSRSVYTGYLSGAVGDRVTIGAEVWVVFDRVEVPGLLPGSVAYVRYEVRL